MKIKTSELAGAALDWAVLVAEFGKHDAACERHVEHFKSIRSGHESQRSAFFSSNWSQGGPIIEREKISVVYYEKAGLWGTARTVDGVAVGGTDGTGPTALVAAMRCFVASRLGDEVEIPAELLS